MEDSGIVELYWRRDENAIRETERKYGRYLLKIADNILSDVEDSRECVNDTYWKAWSSIPPHKPDVLSAYLGKIARQLSIDLYRKRNRDKRRASEYALSLSELEDCVSGGDTTGQEVDARLLAGAVGAYLRTLPPGARQSFLARYYFMDSIREIADNSGMSQSKVKSMLYRTRLGLKDYLKQEGFSV